MVLEWALRKQSMPKSKWVDFFSFSLLFYYFSCCILLVYYNEYCDGSSSFSSYRILLLHREFFSSSLFTLRHRFLYSVDFFLLCYRLWICFAISGLLSWKFICVCVGLLANVIFVEVFWSRKCLVFLCTPRGWKRGILLLHFWILLTEFQEKGNYLSMNEYRFLTLFATFGSIESHSHSLGFKAIYQIVF